MLTSKSGLLVGKVFNSRLKIKSTNSQTTKGYQTMEGSLRVSTSPIDTLQMKVVQVWTSNSCINKKKRLDEKELNKINKRKEERHTLRTKTIQGASKRREWGTIYINWVPNPISKNNKELFFPKPVRRTMALNQTKLRAPRRELVKTNRLFNL